jgi:RNA polymerase sigma-70 factor (ECF subfamily)
LSPSTELVEEILQATLLRAHDALPTYELRGTFVQWLKGIARNLLRQELRARARHLSMAGRTLDALIADDCLSGLDATSEPDPALRECMERLSPHARALLDRRYGQGLPLSRIAQQFKKPADTICVTLHRIRETLRQCLAAKGAGA